MKLKKIYDHYLDKRGEIMKNTQFEVWDVFGDVKGKESITPEETTKLKIFQAKECK